ncbi:CsbD family protein [Amycolatopsis sp. K13G38]|uniref:CsbD family protein n=1 Tax=Amycolatopsis acididurans TaxID=2724524 RepID=A0ABX1J9A8_9PSEU|nr:CsbD family protein [Amycolatopsis acididurans]NKQ54961.1 CsbD family protein [Amycolatopsis acididurans]
MSVMERAKSRSRRLVGAAKQMVGERTGNRRLAAEGRRDRTTGSVRETTNEIRDWAATAARDARRRFGNRPR